jgi:hypothetical protein
MLGPTDKLKTSPVRLMPILRTMRRIAATTLVLSTAMAGQQSFAQPQPEEGHQQPPATSVPNGNSQPLTALLAKKKSTVDESQDNWPTDDFGRPLRNCDVPWDLVPSAAPLPDREEPPR